MGVLRRWRHCLSAAFALLFFTAALGKGFVAIAQEVEKTRLRPSEQEHWERVVATRRRLVGPGSSPPTCRARFVKNIT